MAPCLIFFTHGSLWILGTSAFLGKTGHPGHKPAWRSAMKQLFAGLAGCVESEDRVKFPWLRRRKDSMQDPAMPDSVHGVALLSTTSSESLSGSGGVAFFVWLPGICCLQPNGSWEVRSSPVLTCLSWKTPSTLGSSPDDGEPSK